MKSGRSTAIRHCQPFGPSTNMARPTTTPRAMTDATIRQRIEDFIHDCAHCIDDDRLEEWPGYFTADCRYVIIDRESHAQGLPIGIMRSARPTSTNPTATAT
jgi:hypothetical protein